MTDEKKRFNPRITIPLLAIALIASLAWGYTQYRGKRSWELRSENQYNKSFSELSMHVGELETLLAKVRVSNTTPKLFKSFTDIWRQAYLSQEDMGQLPLASVELAKTKEFLAKVGAFSFNMVNKLNQNDNQKAVETNIATQVLSEKDWTTLNGLHRQARYLSEQLIALQERMLESTEKWVNVDRISATFMTTDVSSRLDTNKITKGFMMMEDGFKRLPEPELEGNLLNIKPAPKGITGENISVEQAREIVQKFVDKGSTRYRVNYEGQINKGNYPLYHFRLTEESEEGRKTKTADVARLGVTVKGGHVEWMLKEREIPKSSISLDEAKTRAQNYLENRGYMGMTPVATEKFRNIALVSLCPTIHETIIYPEMIKIQVALDNGEILGMDATSYLIFHDPKRVVSSPRLTEDEIRKGRNKNLKMEQIKKAIILNDQFQEILCYECIGTLDHDRFRLFVNASSGMEERIQRINEQGVEII